MKETDWYGCYSGNWNGEIVTAAYAHPAKFARGLIRRIYEHALEQGYLKPGDVVLDPFGGVALGACDSISRGMNWVGVELEQKFVNLGNQNIDKWHLRAQHAETMGLDWGRAQLIQGDSRELGAMLGETGGVVSSPPYAESLDRGTVDPAERRKLAREVGISNAEHISPIDMENIGKRTQDDYGSTPGQLGAMRVVSSPPYADGCQHTGGDDPNPEYVQGGKLYGVGIAGAVSSPPYAESLSSDDPDKRGGLYRDEKRRNDKTLTAEYGDSEGQLGRMRVVSSPPYEASRTDCEFQRQAKDPDVNLSMSEATKGYGDSGIGKQRTMEAIDDFWTAARQIMQQVTMVLPPGACAIWVCKGFIRKGEYVDFPDQWRQLGEACGFETIEWIRAWLVEDRGTQYNLFGGKETRTVERKSFFRRLAESKGSPRIDYEVVLIQRR